MSKPTNKPPTTCPCPYCNGTGRAVLTPAQEATLRVVAESPEPPNTSEVARAMGVDVNAARDRLFSLQRAGLVVGTRRGREVVWSAG